MQTYEDPTNPDVSPVTNKACRALLLEAAGRAFVSVAPVLARSLAGALDTLIEDPDQKKFLIACLAQFHLLFQQALLGSLAGDPDL